MKIYYHKVTSLLYVVILATVFLNSYAQVEFIENKGQWNKEVSFMTHAGDGAFFLQKNGFTVLMHNAQDLQRMADKHQKKAADNGATSSDVIHSHAYKVEFINGNQSPEIIPDNALGSVNNYFIGNDESKWASNCKIFKGVTCKNVYPNIDDGKLFKLNVPVFVPE